MAKTIPIVVVERHRKTADFPIGKTDVAARIRSRVLASETIEELR